MILPSSHNIYWTTALHQRSFSQKVHKFDNARNKEKVESNENITHVSQEKFEIAEENIEDLTKVENSDKFVYSDIESVAAIENDDDEGSALLDYYVKKAKDDIDYMDDVDYHDIQDANQRVFYKIVDLWLKEVGSTKRGHREFIRVLLKSLHRFNVESDIKSYLKLLDCFPDGKHTGLKREKWFKSAFQDRLSDHALGVQIMTRIFRNAIPNDKLFDKTYDLFGRFSPATRHARRLIFWYPKFVGPNPHPVSNLQLKQMTPIDIALHGLRQMNPGIKSHYHCFSVDKSKCDESLDVGKIDSVISVQTDDQIRELAKHDTSMPVYVEGPYITYFKTKTVQYYVMRSDPELPKRKVAAKPLTTKDWWEQHYDADWTTGPMPAKNIEENFFPQLDVGEPFREQLIEEITVVDKDTQKVEGSVYALACTDYKSPEALLSWVRGLVPHNPILRECSVLLRDDDAFLLNAPKLDPNESFYETVEFPQPFE